MREAETQNEVAVVARARAGDRRAFGVLVERYMKRAYYTALAMVGNPEDAWDLSQDAFIRAYRALRRFDPQRAAFFTWYYRILRNLCFNFLRDRARRPGGTRARSVERVQLADTTGDAAVIAERNELRERVWRALQELDPKDREVIVLKDFQHLTYREIADLLEIPPGTVMSRLYHARRRLRERLEEIS